MLKTRHFVMASLYIGAWLSTMLLPTPLNILAISAGALPLVAVGAYSVGRTQLRKALSAPADDDSAIRRAAEHEVNALAPAGAPTSPKARRERDTWLNREFDALARKMALRRAYAALPDHQRRWVDTDRRVRNEIAAKRDAVTFWTGEPLPKMTAACIVSQCLEELFLLDRGGFVKAIGWAGGRNWAWRNFCEKNDMCGTLYLLPDPEDGTLRHVWATDPSRSEKLVDAIRKVAEGELPAWPVPVDAETRARCMAAGDYYPEKMAV